MHQSNQTDLVSESKEFIMRRVKHLLEVAPLEQVILSYQNLQIMMNTLNELTFSTAIFCGMILINFIMNWLNYLFSWLFDLHQNGDDEEQQHHPRRHTDYCPMSLCDLVKNTFALFLWMMDIQRVTKTDKIWGTLRGSDSTSVIYLLPPPSGQSVSLVARSNLVPSLKAKVMINSHSNQLRCLRATKQPKGLQGILAGKPMRMTRLLFSCQEEGVFWTVQDLAMCTALWYRGEKLHRRLNGTFEIDRGNWGLRKCPVANIF